MVVSPRTKPISLNPINSNIKYSQLTHSFAVITLRDSYFPTKKKQNSEPPYVLNSTLYN